MAPVASSSTAFLTDQYELTMVQAARTSQMASRASVFEVFSRRLSGGRRYGVVAGVERVLEAVENFRFAESELEFLAHRGLLDAQTHEWLAEYRFTGNIWGYREGELYFPGSPVLVVEGTFAEAVVLETVILSILNYDSAVATAASRMVTAAGTRPCVDMGSRRTHEIAAIAAARAACVAGFTATSNLAAGQRYGLKTIGTSAHSFTLLHDSEEEAFAAQIEALGIDTTLLIDTYDIAEGVRRAIEVAGTGLGTVRIDSGDLGAVARQVRRQLDELGADTTKITVTSDLDEYAIAALAAAPVDSYGVGTRLVTGSGVPTAGFVYKLVARENNSGDMVAVAKKSSTKASVGGRKRAFRLLNDQGQATTELVTAASSEVPDGQGRELLVPLVENGEVVHRPSLSDMSAHHRRSLEELPLVGRRLSKGDPALRTEYVGV